MGAVDRRRRDGFVAFFRSYTKTWVHAVSTAGLTAFGLLTFVNRWFVVLALAAYLVPPVALYLAHGEEAADVVEGRGRSESDAESSPAESNVDAEPSRADSDPSRSDAKPTSADAEPTPTEPDAERPPGQRDAGTVTGDPASSDDSPAEVADRGADWTRTDAPTDLDLKDVAVTDGGVCAVGDGGVVVAERNGEWSVALAEGPAAQGEDLTGVDATADGRAVWIAGDSGALGRIDADAWQHVDYTAPADITDNWTDVAVGGPAGEETVLLANGSGQVVRGEYGDDGPSWAEPVKPGSGSSLSGIDLVDAAVGYCCDTNDGVFETTDGGGSFETVGVDGADGTLAAIAAVARGDCLAAADDGVVHRWDGRTWTPDRVFDDELTGIGRSAEYAVACGDEAVFERPEPAADWERRAFEDDAFEGVDAADGRAVAVGEDGVVVSRAGVDRSVDAE